MSALSRERTYLNQLVSRHGGKAGRCSCRLDDKNRQNFQAIRSVRYSIMQATDQIT